MAINTNVWGETTLYASFQNSDIRKEEYKDYCYMYGNIDESYGKYINSTLAAAIRSGRLQKYDMDVSPAWCASDTNFCMNNGRYVECYYNIGDRPRHDLYTSPKKSTPLMLHTMEVTGPSSWECRLYPPSNINFKKYFYTPNSRIDIPSSLTGKNYNNTNVGFRPFSRIPVQSTVFLVAVCCNNVPPPITEEKSGYDSSHWFDLDCYCNGKDNDGNLIYNKYPYVKGVAIFPFIYNSVSVIGKTRPGCGAAMFLQHFGNYITEEIEYDEIKYKDINSMCQCETSPNRNVINILTKNKDGIASETELFDTVYSYGIFLWGRETYDVATSRTGAWYHYIAGSGDSRLRVEETEWQTSANKYIYQFTEISSFGSISEFYNYFMSQAAYLGLFFTDHLDTAYAGKLTDEEMCLGIIDPSGITHGQYSRGIYNTLQPQFSWTDAIGQTPYDPKKPDPVGPDPNKYNTQSKYGIPSSYAFGSSGTYYVMTKTDLSNLFKALTYVNKAGIDNLGDEALNAKNYNYNYGRFLTNNPMDCIINIKQYPLELKRHLETNPVEILKLGTVVLDMTSTTSPTPSGETVTSGGVFFLDFGSALVYPTYQDFRDFEPYTSLELQLPYCSTISLSPSDYMNHRLGIKYAIDLESGTCLALIFRDDLIMQTVPGMLGFDIPFSGVQSASLVEACAQASANYNTSLITSRKTTFGGFANIINEGIKGVSSAASAGAKGDVAGVVGSGVSSIGNMVVSATNTVFDKGINDIQNKLLNYQLHHVQPEFRSSGSASPNTAMCSEQFPRLIITRPIMMENYNSSNYGHTVGFACLETGMLKNYNGFIVCHNIDTSGFNNATESEKNLIVSSISTGVFLS